MNDPILIGVIGGTGLYSLSDFTLVSEVNPKTPWGYPSSTITIQEDSCGIKVAFLARHGIGHSLSPSEVPNKANIAALKHLGVRVILSFSAVGSLREEIKPCDIILPSQIIDHTKGIRGDTFFEKGLVVHASFGDPFSKSIRSVIQSVGADFHIDKTLVCIEGPSFSTRAESKIFRNSGGDIINMSCTPEAKLCREAEIGYQMVCMATDYDSWKEDEESVDVIQIVERLAQNGENAASLVIKLIPALYEALTKGKLEDVNTLVGKMRFACVTSVDHRDKHVVDKLHYILPGYF